MRYSATALELPEPAAALDLVNLGPDVDEVDDHRDETTQADHADDGAHAPRDTEYRQEHGGQREDTDPEPLGLPLFLGAYPITPASDLLHELAMYKNFGVTTFQAEEKAAAVNPATA